MKVHVLIRCILLSCPTTRRLPTCQQHVYLVHDQLLAAAGPRGYTVNIADMNIRDSGILHAHGTTLGRVFTAVS